MADSILEQISANVLTTLQGITEANGYEITLDVKRATRLDDPRHLHAVVYQTTSDDGEQPIVGANTWVQTYSVVAYVIPLESDTTPIDSYNNQIAASMHVALMADRTRGGLAIDTTIKSPTFFPPIEGEFGGLLFEFSVIYRHALDNPFGQ